MSASYIFAFTKKKNYTSKKDKKKLWDIRLNFQFEN